MKQLLTIAAALMICSAAASAATISETESFSGTPNLTQTLNFDQFDDQGGTLTLQSIQVTISMQVCDGQLVLDNDGEQAASGTFEFGAKADIASTDVSLVDSTLQPVTAELEAIHTGSFSLDANVGDGLNDYDSSAPDGMLYTGGTEADSDTGMIASAAFPGYIGTGTYDIDVSATQWSDFGGVSGIEWAVSPVTASGTVTVTYCYVPEPASMGLLSLGGLALLRRRR
jgi:opacity protein-like surface antigen